VWGLLEVGVIYSSLGVRHLRHNHKVGIESPASSLELTVGM
jgi:hypothetical protein